MKSDQMFGICNRCGGRLLNRHKCKLKTKIINAETDVVGCDCEDKTQCWEPCGELGHDEKYAVCIIPEESTKDKKEND